MPSKRHSRDSQSNGEQQERSPMLGYCKFNKSPITCNYEHQSSDEISPWMQSRRLRGAKIMNTSSETVSELKGCNDFSLRQHSSRTVKVDEGQADYKTSCPCDGDTEDLSFLTLRELLARYKTEKQKVSGSAPVIDIVQRCDSDKSNPQIDSMVKPKGEELDLEEPLINLKMRIAREVNSKRKYKENICSNISDDSATMCKVNHLCGENLNSEADFIIKSEMVECISFNVLTDEFCGNSQQESVKIELPNFPDNKTMDPNLYCHVPKNVEGSSLMANTSEMISASDTGPIVVDQLRNSISIICKEEIHSGTMPCTLNMGNKMGIYESAFYDFSNDSARQNELLGCLVHEGHTHKPSGNNEQQTITLSGPNSEEKDGYFPSISLVVDFHQEAYASEQIPNSENINGPLNETVDVQDPAQISLPVSSGFGTYGEADLLAITEGDLFDEAISSATNFVSPSFRNEEHDSAENGVKLDSAIKSEYPTEKLLSNRKMISPTSQEKLRRAMDGGNVYDAILTSDNRKRLLFESCSRDTDELLLEKTFKRLKGGDIPDTKGILRTPTTSYKIPKRSSDRTKIQDVIAFSQRQIHDIEAVAVRLLKGLKSLKNIVEQVDFPESLTQSRYTFDEIKVAIDNATDLEGYTKKWLTIMARDCNRFCKIMKVS